MNISPGFLWAALVIIAAGFAGSTAWDWFTGQYEVTRFRIVRRWYGISAHICLRAAGDAPDPDRYVVLGYDDEDSAVPWLKVHKLDPDYIRYRDEDAEPFWAPVTDFAPYTVRRLCPHFLRFGRIPVPQLRAYRPLRQPAGYLGDGA
jgi:hypothetical protein